MSSESSKAKDLLYALAARYASMRSYQDQGVCSIRGAHQSPYELTFSTLYSSPGLFRFEFSDPHPYPPLKHIRTRHIIGTDGNSAYAWRQHDREMPKLEHVRSLPLAIAGATGISHGAAHTVARLILPEMGGFSLVELADLVMLENTTESGEACYQIRGRHPRGGQYVVAVEQRTLLLRRAKCDSGTDTNEEIRHSIRVDAALEAASFVLPSE